MTQRPLQRTVTSRRANFVRETWGLKSKIIQMNAAFLLKMLTFQSEKNKLPIISKSVGLSKESLFVRTLRLGNQSGKSAKLFLLIFCRIVYIQFKSKVSVD